MFDSHVHAGPDVVDRIGDDAEVAGAYALADFSGFVLKAHYESTVGRAYAASRSSGQTVYGGVALNQHCGGINPSAAAAALGAGGRVVWMPTADAHTQHTADLPRLCDHVPQIGSHSYAVPPVDTRATEATESVLALIADHDAVLATGHLSGDECRWLSERARFYGIGRLMFTHPSYTVPGLAPSAVRALVESGGHAEITTYQLLHQPGCTPAMLARVAEAASDQLILSSDAGQPDSPSPPEALVLLIDVLAGEGLDRGRLEAAASTVPESLLAPR
ncbi:hypothetical protein SAMN05661080_04412 [Modestobacter sp. DSM 44400]|uniref:DUF6282 family protein n=1 Tax=Modestobacter sp. DSM 44400 TaxID=1550230 RepID=UPI00089B9D2C|nr:DUF6282 family protein [Modestobacter sp. DSM 44400]SDY72632.1 hypothetical protein SAMN05661080_04412 [Modestobacter sp. DSM 44400]